MNSTTPFDRVTFAMIAIPTLAIASLGGLAGTASADLVTLQSDRHGTLYETNGDPRANGLGQHLFAGVTNQGFRRRGLIDFDLAPLLTGPVAIESVTLRLHVSQTNAAPANVGLHRLLADWGVGTTDAGGGEGGGGPATPGSATWESAFYDTVAWTSPGGDFASDASASSLLEGNGWKSWSGAGLVDDLQAMVDGDASRFGWLLLGDETGNGTTFRFDSMFIGDPALRPELIVEYASVPAPGAIALLGIGGFFRGRRRAD
ncbi:MAG: hypothetical protein CMJ27_13175 [Phycisphaerae bacterium]|nr:hypothetical protein [Phycisphaerae bacterium]